MIAFRVYSMSKMMPALPPDEARRGFLLTLRAEGKRSSTVRGYLEVLNAYLRSVDGNDPYERQNVLTYLADVADRCSRPTHRAYFKALKMFFRWAHAEGVCPNAMAGLRYPRLSPDEAERDAPQYTETDRNILLGACPERTVAGAPNWMGLRNRALIWWLWDTPLRSSELCGLMVEDINWEEMKAHVRRGKGGRRYRPNITLQIADATHRYLRQRPHDAEALWVEEAGATLTPHGLRLMLQRMARRAGMTKPVYPHAFRHRFRLYCVELGLSDVEVAAIMGWRSVRTGHQTYGASVLAEQAWARLRERLG